MKLDLRGRSVIRNFRLVSVKHMVRDGGGSSLLTAGRFQAQAPWVGLLLFYLRGFNISSQGNFV